MGYRQELCIVFIQYTLKTGTPVEDIDPILNLLWGVSRPEVQLGVDIHSELDYPFHCSSLLTIDSELG